MIRQTPADFVEENLTNKFHYLSLTGKWKYKQGKHYRISTVEVKCDCGTIKFVDLANLKAGSTKSCGCMTKKLMRKAKLGNISYNDYKYFAPYFLRQIKKHLSRGNNRTLEFNITIEHLDSLYEQQNGLCYYSGIKLILPDFSLGHKYTESEYNISIDRLDPSIGYIKENCVLTTKEINVMKLDYSYEHFINLCSKIHNHQSHRNW